MDELQNTKKRPPRSGSGKSKKGRGAGAGGRGRVVERGVDVSE